MVEYVCAKCGYSGNCKIVKKGKLSTEMAMWLIWMVPGPFYSYWRHKSKKRICKYCDNPNVLSINTEEGFAMLQKQESKLLKSIAKGENLSSRLGNNIDKT